MSRPLWKDAPTWAMWLAQDKDGEWGWWNLKPDRTASLWTQAKENEELFDYLSAGYVDRDGLRFATSENWPESLESRPMTTNQTIDGVPRELLEQSEAAFKTLLSRIQDNAEDCDYWRARFEGQRAMLRALLDAPVNPLSEIEVLRAVVKELEAMRDARVDAKLAKSQGEPVAWIKPDVAKTLTKDECCYAFGSQNPKGTLIPLYAGRTEDK